MTLGETWLGEAEGEVRVQQSWPMEIPILPEPLFDPEGRLRALPGYSYRNRHIVIDVAAPDLAAVEGRIDLSGFTPPDLLALEDALLRAVAAAGYDTACLPGCARVDQARINHGAEVYIRPAPSWQIASWRPLPAAP